MDLHSVESTLSTVWSPHSNCPSKSYICREVAMLLSLGPYTDFVQNHLVQAQFWHDSLNEENYRKHSKFIADINQEVSVNPTYKQNLMRISNITFIMFNKDTMVIPKESEWFGFYKPGQAKDLMTLQESDLWKRDKLGLREMDSQGRLSFLKIEADHLSFSQDFCNDEIMPRLKD